MGAEKIINYSRQKTVTGFFIIVLLGFFIYGFYTRLTNTTTEALYFQIYVAFPLVLIIFSSILGIVAKKAIDYIPGEWKKSKTWVGFEEYESLLKKHEDAYGNLFPKSQNVCISCICLPFSVGLLGVLMVIYITTSTPIIVEPFNSLLLIVLEYGILGVVSYLVGFQIPSIDAKEFFKAPSAKDDDGFIGALTTVPGLRVGVNVEIGEREGLMALFESEWKIFVKDLPETVAVQVQVSHSGFAYPYLIGTIYKGPKKPEKRESLRLRTRYPAIIEYSMDDEVLVMVARFDIPSRTSDVPSISKSDFRVLASVLVERLKSNYNLVKGESE